MDFNRYLQAHHFHPLDKKELAEINKHAHSDAKENAFKAIFDARESGVGKKPNQIENV